MSDAEGSSRPHLSNFTVRRHRETSAMPTGQYFEISDRSLCVEFQRGHPCSSGCL